MTITRIYLLLFAAALLASCHTTGPVSAPIAAGLASAVAILDQLLASGVIDPVQHQQLTGSLQVMADNAAHGLTAAQDAAKQLAEVKKSFDGAPTDAKVGAYTALGIGLLGAYTRLRRGPPAPPEQQAERAVAHAMKRANKAKSAA
jgi:hypothetical protein